MAGEWRDDDRQNWRNQNSDRWQRDRDDSNRQYGSGGRDYGRDTNRDFGREADYPNSGRFSSDDWRDRSWSDQGRGSYGSVYGGYDRSQNRSDGRSGYANDWRNRQMSDLPGYGWSGAGDQGARPYGRDNDWRRRDQYGAYGEYGQYGGNQERGFWDRASDEVSSWFGDEQAERRRQMDQQGEHRGRGPKGYTRSDDRIREDVSDALSDDATVDASEITVAVSNAEVTLTGTVDLRQQKRRAEDCADRVSGVKHVQNNLRVKETTSSTFGSGTNATSGTSTTSTSALGGTSTRRQQV